MNTGGVITLSPMDTTLAYGLAILPKNLIFSKLFIPNTSWVGGERRALELRERWGPSQGSSLGLSSLPPRVSSGITEQEGE